MTRYDLDKVYRLKEFQETHAYANQNMNIQGVREQLVKLERECVTYVEAVKAITEPERAEEDKRYQRWKKWNKISSICGLGTLVLMVLCIGMLMLILMLGSDMSEITQILFIISWFIIIFLTVLGILVFLVTATGTWVCNKNYTRYIKEIMAKIENTNYIFAQRVHVYYREIDTLYLRSLDPAHREMVLMRREQAEHNRRREEQEAERIRLENAKLNEAARTRRAQERLVQIEEAREKRYRGY